MVLFCLACMMHVSENAGVAQHRRRLANCKWVAWKKRMVCEEPPENVLPSVSFQEKGMTKFSRPAKKVAGLAAAVPTPSTVEDALPPSSLGSEPVDVQPVVGVLHLGPSVVVSFDEGAQRRSSWSDIELKASGARGSGLLAALVHVDYAAAAAGEGARLDRASWAKSERRASDARGDGLLAALVSNTRHRPLRH